MIIIKCRSMMRPDDFHRECEEIRQQLPTGLLILPPHMDLLHAGPQPDKVTIETFGESRWTVTTDGVTMDPPIRKGNG